MWNPAAIPELKTVIIWYAVWFTGYLFVRHVLVRSFSADGANRMVSLVHSIVGIVLPIKAINFARLRTDVGTPVTEAQMSALTTSLGYFAYDTLCCLAIELAEGRLDVATLLHHVATLAGLCVGVFQRVSGHELLLCLLLMEISNPFMHLRFLLREAGRGKGFLADVNDLIFVSTFLLSRNVLGVPVVYYTVISPSTPLLVKAGGLGILLVSWFWTGKLLKMAWRKFDKAKPKTA
jgi:hypothetical protein